MMYVPIVSERCAAKWVNSKWRGRPGSLLSHAAPPLLVVHGVFGGVMQVVGTLHTRPAPPRAWGGALALVALGRMWSLTPGILSAAEESEEVHATHVRHSWSSDEATRRKCLAPPDVRVT